MNATDAATSLWADAWRRLRRNRMAVGSAILLLAYVGACVLGPPLFALALDLHYDGQDLATGVAPPSLRHLCGTDLQGRDLLLRILCGGQVSLAVGLLAASVAASVGTGYGAVAGYVGGRVDAAMMRVVDVIYALPYMFLVILMTTLFGKSLLLLFVALGLVGWLTTARLVRGQVLSLKEQEFVQAARALGSGHLSIIGRHLLPNTLGPLIVYFTMSIPAMILQEAFLSFLGLGVQAPRPSLGSLISDGAADMTLFWWLLVFPASAMALLLFALHFLGDGLRDALDPTLREG